MILRDAQASHRFGEALGQSLRAGDVVALSGPLGAGKTSIARGILHGLGFNGEAPSPSFPIVLPYDPPLVCLPIWHVDLYRLEEPDQIEELGLDEALSDGALIIEWPERLKGVNWPNMLRLTLEIVAGEQRRLTADVPPAWEARWSFQ